MGSNRMNDWEYDGGQRLLKKYLEGEGVRERVGKAFEKYGADAKLVLLFVEGRDPRGAIWPLDEWLRAFHEGHPEAAACPDCAKMWGGVCEDLSRPGLPPKPFVAAVVHGGEGRGFLTHRLMRWEEYKPGELN